MQEILIDMLSHYGLKEVDGPQSNSEIIKMGKELGFDIADDSTTAWCSLAMNYYAKKNGYEYSGALDARSWLKMPILVLKPQLGDVVVFWRESPQSWKGHVGLFIAQDNNIIYVLGGNQNNGINVSAYPRDQLLGFRRLRKFEDLRP